MIFKRITLLSNYPFGCIFLLNHSFKSVAKRVYSASTSTTPQPPSSLKSFLPSSQQQVKRGINPGKGMFFPGRFRRHLPNPTVLRAVISTSKTPSTNTNPHHLQLKHPHTTPTPPYSYKPKIPPASSPTRATAPSSPTPYNAPYDYNPTDPPR